MKTFNTAAAIAIGIATFCSAMSVNANSAHRGPREQRFIQSTGIKTDKPVTYLNAQGQRIAFPQFKREIDRTGSFKIARTGIRPTQAIMKVRIRPSQKGE